MSLRKLSTPPALCQTKNYEDWTKLIRIWKTACGLDNNKLGPALLLSLEGEAQDAALHISEVDLMKDDGVDKIIQQLDNIFKKNDTVQKFQILDSFQTYKRQSNISIKHYII